MNARERTQLQATLPAWLPDRYRHYAVKYAPDKSQPGTLRDNVTLSRILLCGIDVAGPSGVDRGTMKGLVPTLLAKRGREGALAFDVMISA